MHYFFVFLLSTPLLHAATPKEITEAQESIKALISPLLPGASRQAPIGTKKFRVDGCERHKINWTNILLMREEVTLKYSFKKDCDIEGTVRPKVFSPFPASFKLRNLDHYSKVDSVNKITASLESRPLLNLEMREGVLQGPKGKVKFEADYQVRVNPLAPKNPIEKNLGGELRITEIYGVKSNIKEKITIK